MEQLFRVLRPFLCNSPVCLDASRREDGTILIETTQPGTESVLPGYFFAELHRICTTHDTKYEAFPGEYGELKIRITSYK